MYAHEHVFEEPYRVSCDECLVIEQRCEETEILDAQYSERHDEIFYAEGERCEATQFTVYEPASVRLLLEAHMRLYAVMWDGEGDLSPSSESAIVAAEKHVNDQDRPHPTVFDPMQDSIEIDVTTAAGTFKVSYEKADQYVE